MVKTTYRRLFAALMLVLASNSLHAQLPPLPCDLGIVARPFLYEIKYNGRHGYLLGTQHIGVRLSDYKMDLGALVASAHTVLTETVHKMYGAKKPPAVKKMRHPNVSERISAEAFSILTRTLSIRNIPLHLVERLPPREILSLLNVDLRLFMRGVIEDEILDIAERKQKPVVALDEDQLLEDLFALTDNNKLERELIRKQAEYLNPNPFLETENKLRGFLKGVEARELALFEVHRLETDDFEAVLADRNRLWLPKITSKLRRRGHFFAAVGEFHLWGSDGLLQMFRNMGAEVVRVP